MTVKSERNFQKNFKKRIELYPKLASQFKKHLELFLTNPSSPVLRDHKLSGKLSDYRAFSVTGDIRVVYKIENHELLLYDIGSHNQVY